MTYIDKSVVPHCFITAKTFDWGEPYEDITPIFNLCADPALSDMAFTIEILGLNNFNDSLSHLYNILLNREEYGRISMDMEPIARREQLLERIDHFQKENASKKAPWHHYFDALTEAFYLEKIEEELSRTLLYER